MKNSNTTNGIDKSQKERGIKEKPLEKIYTNYKSIEKSIVDQLLLEVPNHYLTQGTYRETVWKSLFEQIIPKKFCIDQGIFIIDSDGNISDEVDLAIFDEQYTPYIFNYGKIKFIPIEAVAVVIQCKSDNLEKCNLEDWVASIEKLTTSLNSVARIMKGLVYNKIKVGQSKAQTSTRPIRILCTTHDNKNGVSDKFAKIFDICVNVDKSSNSLVKRILKEEDSYYDWYMELNHFKLERFGEQEDDYRNDITKCSEKIEKKLSDIKVTDVNGNENIILSLIFQLNQLLMLINNPMLFPHESYASLFNKIGEGLNM